jgi:hypothetical protein
MDRLPAFNLYKYLSSVISNFFTSVISINM